jgi:hypothetical protein
MTAFNRIEKIVLVSLTVTFIVAGQIILLNADTSAWASSSVSIEKGYHAPYSTLFVPSILNHVEISIPAMIGVIYAVLSMNVRLFRPVAAIGSAAWAWKCYTEQTLRGRSSAWRRRCLLWLLRQYADFQPFLVPVRFDRVSICRRKKVLVRGANKLA